MIREQPGEQPLKRVPMRRRRGLNSDLEDQDAADEDNAGTALYAAHQTTVYSAPPVVNGRIPRNIYGNLDLYVPSMIPLGGAHIPHLETARAAKIIGIDYADAVTGFVFKGRHGTAVTKGAVIAAEYKEAVEEVIEALENDRARAEEERRTLEALRMWKRMLAGLRIVERIEGYDVEGGLDEPAEGAIAIKEEMNNVDEKKNDEKGGGFLPDRDAEIDVQPTAGNFPAEGWTNVADDEGGGFLAEEEDEDSPVQREIDPPRPRDHFINNFEDDDGGGFLVNDADADAEEALQEINVVDNETPWPIDQSLDHDPTGEEDQENFRQGGGFGPDEDEKTSESTNRTTNDPAIDLATASTDHSPSSPKVPHLPNDELEETMMLQQLYEMGDVDTATSNPNDGPIEQTFNDLSNESTLVAGIHVSHPSTTSASLRGSDEVRGPYVRSDSSGDERSSLLSHDPDDEDADPEWLA